MPRAKTAVFPLLAVVLAAPAAVPAASAADLELSFAAADPAVAALLPVGGELLLRGVPLDGGEGGARDLELRRIEVFAPDAVLQVRREGGDERLPVPDNAYFAGGIAGAARSRAMVSVLESGEVRGMVTEGGRYWLLARRPGEALTRVAEVDSASLAEGSGGYRCATDDLDAVEVLGAPGALPGAERPPAAASVSASAPRAADAPLGVGFTARAAIETDQEYLALFGGSTAQALDYIGDLIAFGSLIYSLEVDTSVIVDSVQLWQSTDPWTQSPGSCALLELGRYWNDNRTGVDRSFVHMLSGKNSNSGIAWVGVLCNGAFSVDHNGNCPLSPEVDNYGGDYGLTGGIDANFDIGNPIALWDIIAVIHEIGHNFNSPHTHCYANVGGNSNPVDQCSNGQCGTTNCWCGSQSLPCATPGAGCGTIMSYCHQLGGNFANIAFTFGQGHPWGVQPQRVPDRMAAHVVQRAASNPGCLDFVQSGEVIFEDGFQSGGTGNWSDAVP